MSQTAVATLPPLPPDRPAPRWNRLLLACGALAGPLFVVTFLLAGATRAHYHPLRHPVSSLELGDHGWVQHANFVVAGLLGLALRAPPAAVLVGIWALGLIGAGIFTTDPVSGYPPGTPDRPVSATVHGTLHDVVS